MRSLVWYSTSLRKTQPKSNRGRSMRNSAERRNLYPNFGEEMGGGEPYLALTHAAQQEGRLDPSQSAQLLLPRRDAILFASIRRERRGRAGCGPMAIL